ncbi:hypothetical protein U1Q18_020591 [Sarracenia purpurea var. burkii]
MPNLPISLLLLLSCALLPLAYSTTTAGAAGAAAAIATHNRRALHQPFFPPKSKPPTQPPSPQPHTRKNPFSTTTPNQPPFFPSISPSPSSPSSPPSSFATFPANISCLILPPPPNPSLRRRRSFSDDKTSRSDNSDGVVHANAGTASRLPKPRRSPPSSSEFLYLGTIVNSHAGADANVAPISGGDSGEGGGDVNLRKLDSPELRPLPPFGQPSFRQEYENADVRSGEEEEDEEFYSPRGSSGGRDSSSGTGSSSRRTLAAVAVEDFDGRSSESSSPLYSSSNSGSPTRSVSISISPPVSLSPRSSRPTSRESVAIQIAPPPPPPLPPRPITTQLPNQKNSSSPSLPSSSSPERASEINLDSSPLISNGSIKNAESSARISAVVSNQLANKNNSRLPSLSSLSSPERSLEKTHDSSPRIPSASNQNLESPARTRNVILDQSGNKKISLFPSSSPEKSSEKIHDSSLRIPSVSNQNLDSPAITCNVILNQLGNKTNSRSSSLSPLSSPERPLGKTQDSSARMSNVSNPIDGSPARTSTTVQKSVRTVAPPPPPPPPRRRWEIPVNTPSSIRRPPVLVTPSRPSTVCTPTLISPIELLPSSENAEKNEEILKPKLKPLHWDKVRASSNRETVWDQLKSSSFKYDMNINSIYLRFSYHGGFIFLFFIFEAYKIVCLMQSE